MKYRYALYFEFSNGGTDSYNVVDAVERDLCIEEAKKQKQIVSILWCRIYASGEYGSRIRVK